MISINRDTRIFVFTGTTDMRKGFRGLCGLVHAFSEDPVDGSFYVFSNRSRNRLKILQWDGDGFILYYKCLEKGLFDIVQSAERKQLIDRRQLLLILEGVEPLKIRKNLL